MSISLLGPLTVRNTHCVITSDNSCSAAQKLNNVTSCMNYINIYIILFCHKCDSQFRLESQNFQNLQISKKKYFHLSQMEQNGCQTWLDKLYNCYNVFLRKSLTCFKINLCRLYEDNTIFCAVSLSNRHPTPNMKWKNIRMNVSITTE